MKKFLFLVLGLVLFASVNAQLVTLTGPGQQTGAVTSNVGPQKVIGSTRGGGATTVSAVLLVTKSSGVVAGNANLQGSHDNVTWIDIGTQVTLTDVATQAFGWKDPQAGYQWYRIRVTSTTGTYTPTGTMLIRK